MPYSKTTIADLAEEVRTLGAKLDRLPDLTDSEREALHDMARIYLGVRAMRGLLMFGGTVLGGVGSLVMGWPKIKAWLLSILT